MALVTAMRPGAMGPPRRSRKRKRCRARCHSSNSKGSKRRDKTSIGLGKQWRSPHHRDFPLTNRGTEQQLLLYTADPVDNRFCETAHRHLYSVNLKMVTFQNLESVFFFSFFQKLFSDYIMIISLFFMAGQPTPP